MGDPAAVVDAFLAAIEARDIDGALGHLSPDVVYDNVPLGPVTGIDEVRRLLGPMLAACTEVEWRVERRAANGPVVMNERLDRFAMDGRWIEVPVAGVFEVHDGAITLWRDYFDEPTYRNQLAENA